MTAEPIILAPSFEPVDEPILVGLLGPLHILGEPGPTARMRRQVLALLALRAGEQVSTDEFFWELWDGTPPAAALQSVQTYVMTLRRIPYLGQAIETRPRGYCLSADPFEIDALRFGIFTTRARRHVEEGRVAAAQDALTAAFSLLRGPVLGEVDCGPLLTSLAAGIEDCRLDARDLMWDIDLRTGRHREVVNELRAAVRADPAREDAVAKLMLALYRSNRRADALRTYAEVRSALISKYGLEPCPALRRLQGQVLAGDPTLDLNGGAA